MLDKPLGFLNDWWRDMDELEKDLEDAGYEIVDSCRLYVEVFGGENETKDDIHYTLYLGGTDHTVIVEKIETEVIRG